VGLTEAEKTLPWKRSPEKEEIVCLAPIKQREFPAWLKNEAYMVHGTPTDEVLTGDQGERDAIPRRQGQPRLSPHVGGATIWLKDKQGDDFSA